MIDRGIILAGGLGSRLSPLTKVVNKQLLPLYDKPIIYYSLSVLMLAGIKKILIITNPSETNTYKNLLGNGSQLGINIEYEIQLKPEGLPQAFLIGEKFIDNNGVALILGDNFFYGQGFSLRLKKALKQNKGSTIFLYPVENPSQYGVVELNKKNKIIKIIEKPKKSKSNLAITGLYFFDNKVVDFSKKLKPSIRKELEIIDLILRYKKNNLLKIEYVGRGGSWLDTGTHKDLFDASQFVNTIERRQGLKIACIEEIAFRNKWINKTNILKSIRFYGKCDYSNYLKKLIK
jgi:glucose-1-phosphate thymidylyltransferase